MDTFDASGIHVDLMERFGFRHLGNEVGGELQSQRTPAFHKNVGSLCCVDKTEEPPQDPVLVEGSDVVEGSGDLSRELAGGSCVGSDAETYLEQADEGLGDHRVCSERVVDVPDRKRRRDESPVAAIRTQDRQILVSEIGRHKEAIEGVRLGFTQERSLDRLRNTSANGIDIQLLAVVGCDPKIVDEGALFVLEPRGNFFDNDETKMLHQRHDDRQVQLPRLAVDGDPRELLMRHRSLGRIDLVLKTDDQFDVGRGETFEGHDVARYEIEGGRRGVVVGELAGPRVSKPPRFRFTHVLFELVEHAVFPVTSESDNLVLELLKILDDRCTCLYPHGEVDSRIAGLTERQPVVDRIASESLQEERLQLPSEVHIEAIPRNRHEDGHEALENIPAHEQAHRTRVLGLNEFTEHLAQRIDRHRKEVILGERLEELDDRLVVVGPFDDILDLEHLLEFAAQYGDLTCGLDVRL